jgi:nitric oxide reductase subunit B
MNQTDPSLPIHRDDGGIRSTVPRETRRAISEDPVGRVLRWVLLATAIACFAMIGWATLRTYRDSPPVPARFTGADSAVLMTGEDIVAGKSGFQKADLMDYGSLYGMGSYFGPDYTAQILVALAHAAENAIARATTGQDFGTLPPDQQSAIRVQMQAALHQIDLTREVVALPDPLSHALITVRDDVAVKLRQDDVA